ncbi:protein of unknown function [Paraburkholderia kururiensis]|uniref:hypothetical protein n=1 Tax=Paraburkholderia kururiensis TaxID=984307 RepID=UPI0039A494FA
MNQLPDIDVPTWIRTVSQAEAASVQTAVEDVFFTIDSPSPGDYVRFRRAVAMLVLLGQQEVIIEAVGEMHDGIRPQRLRNKESSRFRSNDIDKAVKIADSLRNCFAIVHRAPDSRIEVGLEAVHMEHALRNSTTS